MGESEMVELLESELTLLVNKAHRSGLSYWLIYKVCLLKMSDFATMLEIRDCLKE